MKRLIQMKRVLRTVVLVMLLGVSGTTIMYASYDFSAVCETGQTLYYNIIDANNHYVKLVSPVTPEFSSTNYGNWIQYGLINDPWEGHERPIGKIILPEFVTMNEITYAVTEIGDCAFYKCIGLTDSLTIPSSVTEIGKYAFFNCSGLTGRLTIPNSVTTIRNSAFYSCQGLTGELIIPNYVTEIEMAAFGNCSGFSGSLILPDALTVLGGYAFFACQGLTGELIIPDSVLEIGPRAFRYCEGITSVTIQGNPYLDSEVFGGCIGIEFVKTLATVQQFIQDYAFYNLPCTNLIVPCNCIPAYETSIWHEHFTTINEDCTSVAEDNRNVITVYPNPTKGNIIVEAENLKHITISNTLGQTIFEGNASGDTFEYNFGKHGAGLYLIRIETANGIVVKKVSVTQ